MKEQTNRVTNLYFYSSKNKCLATLLVSHSTGTVEEDESKRETLSYFKFPFYSKSFPLTLFCQMT